MRIRFLLIASGALLAMLLGLWLWNRPSEMDSYPLPLPFALAQPKLAIGEGSIEGRVVDDRGPLAQAWISLRGEKKLLSVPCEADGSFRLTGLAEGSFEIVAGARGYRPASVRVDSGAGPVTIGLEPLAVFGQGPDPPEAPAPSEKFLARIVRPGGSTQGFAAALLPLDPPLGAGIFRAEVDSEGFFQIEGLRPGLYELRILSAARAYDLAFCYRVERVQIGGEASPPDSFEVRCREISGRVYAAAVAEMHPPSDPLPHEGAVVRLRLRLGEERSAEAGLVDSGADGSFRFVNLPEGDYEITVMATDFQTLRLAVPSSAGFHADLGRLVLPRKP